jgi:hypothetical protein
MKKISLSLFLAALLCVLAACPNSMPDNSVTINGTVTITRNGIPWNRDNFHRYSYSRAAPPPTDRPRISAYYKDGGWVTDSVSVSYRPDSAAYRNGTYQWSLNVPADKLPCTIRFYITCPMLDVESRLGTTKEFWGEDKNTSVDLGVINFDVIRISGNLPVTVNNKPFGDYDDYTVGYMNISDARNSNINGWTTLYNFWSTDIRHNGDWSLNIARPDSEISLEFQVEVRQNGGVLRKTLNPDNAVTIYDTDKEVVFPDYPSVNLEAFLLSGTIEVVAPGTGDSRYFSISFYREGAHLNPPDYTSDSVLITYLLSDTTTEWSASGLKEWKTTIPVLELPHELIYSFSFYKGGEVYKGHSSVIITGDTDLSNINLGVFTFE